MCFILGYILGKGGFKKPTQQQQNLATVCYETIKYLEKTTCVLQNAQIIQDFMLRLAPFKLTKAEKLSLLNLRPTTAVEIQLLVEESEERLSEEQIEELLVIITETLPELSTEAEEPMEEGN